MRDIQEGDLVTVELGEFSNFSNTYQVFKKVEGACVLSHPLAPECLTYRQDTELNNYMPSPRSQLEKCLRFSKKSRENLGPTMSADLDALCYYFIIKKQFTPKQRHDLENICGKIASVVLGNSVSSAITMIKQNKVLLDEYNHSLYNGVKRVIDDPLSLKAKGERYTVFNIAGFILAQLSST